MTATNDFGAPDMVRVTLRRSVIGQSPKARGTIRALGLTKINTSNVLEVRPTLLGMLRRVQHLVTVEPVNSPTTSTSSRARRYGPSDRRITGFDRDDEGIHLSFVAGLTVKQAHAAMRGAMEGKQDVEATALAWDAGAACLREYTSADDSRLSSPQARLALSRFESPRLVVGVEPPLSRVSKNVEIFVHADRDATSEAADLVREIGGDVVAGELRDRLKELEP